jgi:hypothetical protein
VLSESYGPINSWFISAYLSDLAVEFVPSGGRDAVKFLTRLQIEETQKTDVVSSQVCVCVPGVVSGHFPVVGLQYVLIFPDMSSFSRLKLPSGRNL